MANQIVIHAGGERGKRHLLRIRETLANPEKILKQIGNLLVATSQESFEKQALGEIKWPARYPNQSAPKLNIAGVVQDLEKGSTVKSNRFQDRPALESSGALLKSINKGMVSLQGSHTVKIGTPAGLWYARLMQFGGRSTQKVTPTIKKNLGKFLRVSRDESGKFKDIFNTSRNQKRKESGIGKIFRDKLFFLFHVEEIETTVHARPFIGITDQDQQEIPKIIMGEIAK